MDVRGAVRRRWTAWGGVRRPRVLEIEPERVRTEGSVPFPLAWRPTKVAVLAHWSSAARVSRSVETMVAALTQAGFDVVVVSTCESSEPLQWPTARPERTATIRRPNLGYDFGSWAVALDRFPHIAEAPHVLLLNDSLLGPFADIQGLLQRAERCDADVCALTDSPAIAAHLQSYFLWFHGGLLREPMLRAFFADIRVHPSKSVVVRQYEIGLSELLHHRGYTTEALFPYSSVVGRGQDPTIHGWRELLESGYPFLKRIVLRHPDAPHREDAVDVVRQVYGEDLAAWL